MICTSENALKALKTAALKDNAKVSFGDKPHAVFKSCMEATCGSVTVIAVALPIQKVETLRPEQLASFTALFIRECHATHLVLVGTAAGTALLKTLVGTHTYRADRDGLLAAYRKLQAADDTWRSQLLTTDAETLEGCIATFGDLVPPVTDVVKNVFSAFKSKLSGEAELDVSMESLGLDNDTFAFVETCQMLSATAVASVKCVSRIPVPIKTYENAEAWRLAVVDVSLTLNDAKEYVGKLTEDNWKKCQAHAATIAGRHAWDIVHRTAIKAGTVANPAAAAAAGKAPPQAAVPAAATSLLIHGVNNSQFATAEHMGSVTFGPQANGSGAVAAGHVAHLEQTFGGVKFTSGGHTNIGTFNVGPQNTP